MALIGEMVLKYPPSILKFVLRRTGFMLALSSSLRLSYEPVSYSHHFPLDPSARGVKRIAVGRVGLDEGPSVTVFAVIEVVGAVPRGGEGVKIAGLGDGIPSKA